MNKGLLQLSEENLSKGLKLDKQSYTGYFGKATLLFWGRWDFINGQKFFLKAIELNPSYTEAEEGLCELYTAIGYFEKALWHTDNILRINPLSPNHYYTKANIYYLKEDYSKALECIEISLSINPDFTHSIGLKQLCFILTKDHDKLNDFLDNTPLAERAEECRVLYKLVNPEDKVDIDISRVSSMLKKEIGEALFPWQLFLMVHLGKHEMALDFLEENIKMRTGQIINYMNIPLLQPLHQYQRFQDLQHAAFRVELLPPNPQIQIQITPTNALMEDAEIDIALDIIEKGMTEEKWYQNPSLSLRELAENLKISSNQLSWLLNERIGRNFNEYINSFRLEHFKEITLNPANGHLTLLALAYESGFNSKTVFNTFFKKTEGMTPKAWLRSNQT
jgi:AraC-like DNA-binding protein